MNIGKPDHLPVSTKRTHDLPRFTASTSVKSNQSGHHRHLPFVGSAQSAAQLTDSASGQLLEAWADKQMGGASLKGVDVFWWGDAENAMDYWINGLDQHPVALGTQQRTGTKMGGI